jgi:hypothetical protein
MFGTKYKMYLKTQGEGTTDCTYFYVEVICSFPLDLVFKTIVCTQGFYNQSPIERNKAKIVPEINPLGNHIFLTKNHGTHSE